MMILPDKRITYTYNQEVYRDKMETFVLSIISGKFYYMGKEVEMEDGKLYNFELSISRLQDNINVDGYLLTEIEE